MKQDNKFFLKHWLKELVILLSILLAPAAGFTQPKDCKDGSRHLQGGFEVIQARGGLWAYFERSEALKDKSMLGMQADSKLQRAVVIYQNQCLDKSTSPPTAELYKRISDLIDTARAINNKSSIRTPPKKIVASVQDLLKNLDILLKN